MVSMLTRVWIAIPRTAAGAPTTSWPSATIPAGNLSWWNDCAAGDSQLHGHQIDPGDLLGDRVLHLDPGVDLEEDELLTRHQELDGGESTVVGLCAQPRCGPV